MKNLSRIVSLAALLLGAAASARAAAAPGRAAEYNRYAYADKTLDALAKKIGEVKSCISRLDALKEEIAAKKSEISSQNGGTIPPAYVDVIALKQTRLEKIRTACFSANKEIIGLVEAARGAVRGIEPPSSSGVPKRRERLVALQTAANSVAKNLH